MLLTILLIAFAIISISIVILVLVGMFMLPKSFQVERSISIKAPAENIFPMINRLRHWQEWSAWNMERYPEMKIDYEGADAGVGAKQSWITKSGSGSLWITKSVEPTRLSYEMQFSNFPILESTITLTESDGETEVDWSSSGAVSSFPFGGWMALLMPRFIGSDYQKGLGNLKRVVETGSED